MNHFTIPLEPTPKGRPRLGKFGVYTPERTQAFERDCIRLSRKYAPVLPLEGPVLVLTTFWMKKPKVCKSIFPTARFDVDNLLKGILDSFNGLFWVDDAQVTDALPVKRYCEPGTQPRIDVTVIPLTAPYRMHLCFQDGRELIVYEDRGHRANLTELFVPRSLVEKHTGGEP